MKAIILAAGRGTRLGSEEAHLPKVLRKANGRALLSYVLDSISFIPRNDIVLVVGYEKEKVIDAYPDIAYCVQETQKGTGHAAMSADGLLSDYDGNVLIVCGDMPMMKYETLKSTVDYHEKQGNDCTLVSFVAKEKMLPYGRIMRDESGVFCGIIEEKDATPEQRLVRELNAGVYVYSAKKLFKALKKVQKSSATGELYLTDVPLIMAQSGDKVSPYICGDAGEFDGVNTLEDLQAVEKRLKEI